jgi:hypothetical protein
VRDEDRRQLEQRPPVRNVAGSVLVGVYVFASAPLGGVPPNSDPTCPR